MKFTHLVYIRSRYAFSEFTGSPADIPASENSPVILSPDSMVFGIATAPDADVKSLVFGTRGLAKWIDYWEVVELGFYSAFADPIYSKKRLFDELVEMPAPRTSERLARGFLPSSSSKARGRKLLLIQFDTDNQWDTDKIDNGIRSTLSNSVRCVWHSKRLKGYCFSHLLNCQKVTEYLQPVLNSRGVADFLMIEPVAVSFTTQESMSPLKNWTDGGFREVGDAKILARKTNKVGRRGS